MVELFDEIRKARGGVANIYNDFREVSEITLAHFRLNKQMLLEETAPLSRIEREILAVETSRANKCEYCLFHHQEALNNHLKSNKISDEKYEVLKKLAEGLSLNPSKAYLLKGDFQKFGYSEAQWQHAVNIVSYFNYTNRLALAVEMKLEAGYENTCR